MNERRTKWEEYPDIMNSTDVMEIMNITKETLQKFTHMSGWPAIRVHGGRKYIYVKSALQEYLHKQALGER